MGGGGVQKREIQKSTILGHFSLKNPQISEKFQNIKKMVNKVFCHPQAKVWRKFQPSNLLFGKSLAKKVKSQKISFLCKKTPNLAFRDKQFKSYVPKKGPFQPICSPQKGPIPEIQPKISRERKKNWNSVKSAEFTIKNTFI